MLIAFRDRLLLCARGVISEMGAFVLYFSHQLMEPVMEAKKTAKPDAYREWFDKEVKRGLDDLEAGRVVPDAVVRENILKSRLNRLRARKKAA